MSADCPACAGHPFMVCDGCGDHVMPAHPSGLCADCRGAR